MRKQRNSRFIPTNILTKFMMWQDFWFLLAMISGCMTSPIILSFMDYFIFYKVGILFYITCGVLSVVLLCVMLRLSMPKFVRPQYTV